jgi:phenylpyruvate tautomerase PptA (4-oxalocrotonate tautomerase family)
MSAITIHVNHVGPVNKRKLDLIKAATQLLKDVIGKESQTELIVVENKAATMNNFESPSNQN